MILKLYFSSQTLLYELPQEGVLASHLVFLTPLEVSGSRIIAASGFMPYERVLTFLTLTAGKPGISLLAYALRIKHFSSMTWLNLTKYSCTSQRRTNWALELMEKFFLVWGRFLLANFPTDAMPLLPASQQKVWHEAATKLPVINFMLCSLD